MLKRCSGGLVLLGYLVVAPLAWFAATVAVAEDDYYTESKVFGSRPVVNREKHFGCVGATGLELRIYKGVELKVEGTLPGSPAEGKFKPGEVIAGINGMALKGKNPYVVLGEALTRAESTDGRMVFAVEAEDGAAVKSVAVRIPVLGAYSKTWPLNCEKSRTIVKQAAEYYALDKAFGAKYFKEKGIPAALASLFLLSTGDDAYLPRVKAYMDSLADNIGAIGDHTWNNGYNGIACAEYFLRTGDKSVLPLLQYYCDNAKERQFFGVGWGHWGRDINPRYVAGGLMNPAGCQVLTSLLLAKECGVDVDEDTLLGALTQWYRFVGHGTVPYGDHRAEGGLGSNGKDGMAAAAMQIASYAQGNAAIYRHARDYLSMSTLTSYPGLVTGHGDDGRGDGIWRGIASAYMLDIKPGDYHEAMKRLQWWYDLSRRPSGALGMATCQGFNDVGSGAGVAMAYTAPLKTLRITGAPRTENAVDFTLPEHLWGRKSDLAFLSIEHGRPFRKYGRDEPVHIPFYKFGSAYNRGVDELGKVPRHEMLKNVYHKRYMIRAQAAKALRRVGAFDELEKLLRDRDPRVRRAALDGMTDYRYWFAMGKDPIETENVSPAMIEAIKKMLSDPRESLYVVDGALMAMSRAPAATIADNLSLILPWTSHEDWWLRQSSFLALAGAARDEELISKVLPAMLDMFVKEYRTQAREWMQNDLTRLLRTHKPDSAIGRRIVGAFKRSAREGKILPGLRAGEGAYNVVQSALTCVKQAPETAVEVAGIVKARLEEFQTRQIESLVAAFLETRESLPEDKRAALSKMLYEDYRRELIRRMDAEPDNLPLDTILSLTQLQSPQTDWVQLGEPGPEERVWRFITFEPQPGDFLHPREKKRFRDVELPESLEGWNQPGFDDSKWQQGKAPIGSGEFRKSKTSFENRSEWGQGEFLLMRTEIEIDSLDYDFYRINVLANQGFRVYLNGHAVHTYIWWKNDPHYRPIGLGANEIRRLKKGANLIAVYANAEYIDGKRVGQIDIRLEALKKADLLKGYASTTVTSPYVTASTNAAPGQTLESIFAEAREQLSQANTNGAIEILQTALEGDSLVDERPAIYGAITSVMLMQGRLDEVKQRLLRDFQADPQLSGGALGVVRTHYLGQQDSASALAWVEQLLGLELEPGMEATLRGWQAEAYLARADEKRVLELATEAVAELPGEFVVRALGRTIGQAVQGDRRVLAGKLLDLAAGVDDGGEDLDERVAVYRIDLKARNGELAEAIRGFNEFVGKGKSGALSYLFSVISRQSREQEDRAALDRLCMSVVGNPEMSGRLREVAISEYCGAADTPERVDEYGRRVAKLLEKGVTPMEINAPFTRDFGRALREADTNAVRHLVVVCETLAARVGDPDAEDELKALVLDGYVTLDQYRKALDLVESGFRSEDAEWMAVVDPKLRAHLAMQENRHAQAIEHLRRFMRAAAEAKQKPDEAVLNKTLGLNAYRIGNLWRELEHEAKARAAYREAQDYYRKALEAPRVSDVMKKEIGAQLARLREQLDTP